MPDQFTDRLSAYLDGELGPLERRRLEAHLIECAECTAALADLRAITAVAPDYQGREPARDLWPDIEARLEYPDVRPISSSRPAVRPSARPPVRLSWPQLIAASLAIAAVGGGTTWLALRQGPGTVVVQPSSRPAIQPPVAKTIAYAESQYAAAVADLTRILEQGRSRLDSGTVRVIEESLWKIDAAIAEARAAIQRDSSNVYLNRQIEANMRRKLNLLRTAADAIART